jgi:hypothetical protein
MADPLPQATLSEIVNFRAFIIYTINLIGYFYFFQRAFLILEAQLQYVIIL